MNSCFPPVPNTGDMQDSAFSGILISVLIVHQLCEEMAGVVSGLFLFNCPNQIPQIQHHLPRRCKRTFGLRGFVCSVPVRHASCEPVIDTSLPGFVFIMLFWRRHQKVGQILGSSHALVQGAAALSTACVNALSSLEKQRASKKRVRSDSPRQ